MVGFVFLLVQQLCLVWWAYHSRRIQLMDLRVWFAAHEMVARRCQLGLTRCRTILLKNCMGSSVG